VWLSVELMTIDLDKHRRDSHTGRYPLRSSVHRDEFQQESAVWRPLCGCRGKQCWGVFVCVSSELGGAALAWYVFHIEGIKHVPVDVLTYMT